MTTTASKAVATKGLALPLRSVKTIKAFQKKSDIPEPTPGKFISPYQEQLETLYRAQNFKGRPPKDSAGMLGKLIRAGHFPWLNAARPKLLDHLINGSAAYQDYLYDLRASFLVDARKTAAHSSSKLQSDRSVAGKKSVSDKRARQIATLTKIVCEYQSALGSSSKPDAFNVATWKILDAFHGLALPERHRKIRSLTKSLRHYGVAI